MAKITDNYILYIINNYSVKYVYICLINYVEAAGDRENKRHGWSGVR